ncbi:MAG: FAD-dependent oxidoreductase [Solirubrobacterales bacterium]|nr:FAD-dependent oxidoreductase [Solirubrobacterales bacterium]
MAADDASSERAQILIAGGGFAAVEAALALRALAGGRVALTILAPDPVFHYRPAATTEPFDVSPSRQYDLRAIADDLKAEYHESRLEAVASRVHFVRTAAGVHLPYATLILATGARSVVGVPGAITFRDQRDIPLIRRLLGELEAGAVRSIVFALPGAYTWPLPLYELALLTARHARERRLAIEVTLVTSEREPLELFGTQTSRLVRGLLEKGGVRFRGGVVATGVQRDRSLTLADGETIQADGVVALPELRARRITGVPAKRAGFVPVDASGRVQGLQDVYAAGDTTTFPIKQGGLAAQQADVVAQTIAARLGVSIKEVLAPRVLQARLLGGDRALFLRTEFDWSGQPTRATLVRPDDEHAAKTAKVLGRYLVPYLETREALREHGQAAAGTLRPSASG